MAFGMAAVAFAGWTVACTTAASAATPQYAQRGKTAPASTTAARGPRVSRALRAASAAGSVEPGPLPGGAYVAAGSRSRTVRWLQRRLTAVGFAAVADGVFGSRTAAGVAGFQRAAGLLVDGVVGRQTMAALTAPGVAAAVCPPGARRRRCGVEASSSRLEAGSRSGASPARPIDDGRRTLSAGRAGSPPARLPGRYIVVFRRSVDSAGEKTSELERDEGFRSRFRYGRALKGFAGRLSADQVRELRRDPEVALVSPDRPVKASSLVLLRSGDSAPSGVRRIGAATATRGRQASTESVAVLDTGIDLAHTDLDAGSGKNCVGSGSAGDDHGHGTHVAGTIAARNNGSGVVGVAPGTRVYAVKVLDAAGSGSLSQVICGIDWVTATRRDADRGNDVAVANLSLGGIGVPVQDCATSTDPMHRAICTSTAAGVTYVVAAGNDGREFDSAATPDTPAAYPQVLAVSAMADSDGRPGRQGGAPSCRAGEADDRYASFSNYARTADGQAHTIAAPGVCINSTLRGGSHGRMSGTSMAAPHISGAVALCLGEGGESGPCAGLAPREIIDRIRSDAERYTRASPTYGFDGDPGSPAAARYLGYLQFAGSESDTAAPRVTDTSPRDSESAVPTSAPVTIGFSEAMERASVEAAFSLRGSPDGAAVAGSFTWSGNTVSFQPSSAFSGRTTYTATVSTRATDTAGDALETPSTFRFETAPPTGAPPPGGDTSPASPPPPPDPRPDTTAPAPAPEARAPSAKPPPAGAPPPGRSTAAPDRTPPALRVRRRSVKAGRTLPIVVGCAEEPCTLKVLATVYVRPAGRAVRVFRLEKITARAPKGAAVTLKLRQSRKALPAVRSALSRRRSVTARIAATATDAAGNSVTRIWRIRLRR